MLKLSDMTSHATCGRISVEVEGREGGRGLLCSAFVEVVVLQPVFDRLLVRVEPVDVGAKTKYRRHN